MICFIRHILKLHVLFVGIDVLLHLSIFVFTFTTYYYLGYPCLLVYAVWSFNRIKHASRYKFSCGNCGAKMKNKGVCPHCGAVNE